MNIEFESSQKRSLQSEHVADHSVIFVWNKSFRNCFSLHLQNSVLYLNPE